MRALNTGRPSIEDIKGYSQHIAQKTFIFIRQMRKASLRHLESVLRPMSRLAAA